MLTIGEFSRICMVTAKTLRHYDGIGLLKPAVFNPETGYRYYHASQLKDMLDILKLKQYGFSLEEIKGLLNAGQVQLRESLKNRSNELAAEIEMQKILLHKMKTDILNLEKGLDIMETQDIEIKLVETIDTNIISARENIAIRDFDKLMGRAAELLQQSGAVCVGPPVAVYHSPEFDPENTDIEIGFPVSAKSDHTRTLKGTTCAAAVHMGEYATLHETYMKLGEWIGRQGYTITDPPYEIYLNDPREVPAEELKTEVYFPIEK